MVVVAMAASKENNPSCSSSSSASAHRRHATSLRPPLSPIHHNSSSARPSEHPTLALRRTASNPSRAPLPSSSVKSPPLHPSHLPRNPSLPRSPNPSTVGRKLLRDGAPTLDLATRFNTQKEKDRTTPAASTPRRNSSFHISKPPQAKRQTQLFVQQKAPLEPLFVDKAGSCNPKWMEHLESETKEKPCRRKWRRYPRESVLRSLRGGDGHGSFSQGLAETDTEKLSRNPNPCCEGDSSPKKAALNGNKETFQRLSFAVYAGGKFSTGNQAPEYVNVKEEEKKEETIAPNKCQAETCDGSVGFPSDDITISTVMSIPGSRRRSLDEKDSCLLTPPPGSRSLSLTPQPERNLTPPMQPTQSPDFIKREGARTLLPIDGTCYAAPCALVKDRRKCKPRGMLTVDAGQEILSSAESELGFVLQQSTQQLPTPAVASVEWMLDEKKNLGNASSPELVSASTDMCRMSFPRLSPVHDVLPSEQLTESSACEELDDACKLKQGSSQQASFSISNYEWGASSSQGMLSSYRSEINSANPRRSIIFDHDDDVDKSRSVSAKSKSTIMHTVLFEELPDVSNVSMDFSDEESSECLPLREGAPLQGSPPFEYSLLSSLNIMDLEKIKQRSWSQGSPEEVMLSMSGPMDSSLSYQEHETDGKCDANSLVSALCNNMGPISHIKGGGWNFLQKVDERAYDTGSEARSDISSRIAMAKFLCNITATYLDDIATSLGKSGPGVELERSPCKETFDTSDNINLEHSSLISGRKKMVECCSLLRGLTLETSKSRETSSECSVNQPSPSLNEDTADSLQTHVLARHHPRKISRFEERSASLCESMEACLVELRHESSMWKASHHSNKGCLPATKFGVEACLPSKGFVAGSYLLAGLFVISHTYYKHVKRAEQIVQAHSLGEW